MPGVGSGPGQQTTPHNEKPLPGAPFLPVAARRVRQFGPSLRGKTQADMTAAIFGAAALVLCLGLRAKSERSGNPR